MRIVITGASRGLGASFADTFADEGNTLFLGGKNEESLRKREKELKQRYPACNVQILAADLSKQEEARKWGEWVIANGGAPDVVINNAGSFIMGTISTEPAGALEQMISTNLYSAYQLTRTLLPAMKAKQKGHIFNICSIASLEAYENGGAYSISKFALYGFSKNLRKELMPFGIKVTHVIPGAIYTDSWKESGVSPERMMECNDIALMIKASSSLSPQACVEEIILRPVKGDL